MRGGGVAGSQPMSTAVHRKGIEKETENKVRNAKRRMEKELSRNKDKNNRQFTLRL
jgi:hypothetical protein